MKNNGLVPYTIPTSVWENSFTSERILSDWSWLLAYEGIRHGWLNDPKGLMNEPFFQSMAVRDIEFYDPRRNVRASKNAVRARRSRSKRDNQLIAKLLLSMRGLGNGGNFSDY
jgi:hypothetical protein